MTEFPMTHVPADLADREIYDGMIIPLYMLYRQVAAKGETAIVGKTFRRCRIDGPSVLLALGGNAFDGCHFGDTGGDVDSLLLQPLSQRAVTGAIPVGNCRFESCNFFAIGFTGAEPFLQDMRAAVPAGAE
jgi:hypothetical protein